MTGGMKPARIPRAKWERWRDERPAVAVAIPMVSMLHRPAVQQFLRLAKHLRDDDTLLLAADTAFVNEARNSLIRQFLALDPIPEYLFFFDDDMTIPVGTIELMTWRGHPFLSGLCTHKSFPYLPVPGVSMKLLGLAGEDGDGREWLNNVTDFVPNSGVRLVHSTGGACLCLHRDLLLDIPDPWFEFTDGRGEDVVFCQKVREAGYEVLIDTMVMPGHIGTIEANYTLFLQNREAAHELHGEINPQALLDAKAS